MTKFSCILLLGFMVILVNSCESEQRIPPRGYLPNTPEPTEQLEASYFWIAQDQPGSSYWKDADYLLVPLNNASIHTLYSDGYLNMTGTYNGLTDFNQGRDPEATLKAGYDDEFIYILVEWKDTTANASDRSWIFDGPVDPHKPDTTSGWTSQRNNDNFMLIFNIEGSDTHDAWKWSLASTAPFNMANNLLADASGHSPDAISNRIRNSTDTSSRNGPAHEWNGERQEIILPDSTPMLLDPAYYLLDDHKTGFTGDPVAGRTAFNQTADCKFCHGPNGNGDFEGSNGGNLNDVSTLRMSRESLIEYISDVSHEGSGDQYWGRIKNNETQVSNLLAFMRGIAGVPGYSLLQPQVDAEIKALVNIGTGTINAKNSSYKVLLIRRLNTGDPDDVVFAPDRVYNFSIRFSDDDGINFIGATNLQLVFKSKEL